MTPADHENHVDKHNFKVPFVCGARNLGEALRRISEGATMIRTKGEAGTGEVVGCVKVTFCTCDCHMLPQSIVLSTGNVVEAVRHARAMQREIRVAQSMSPEELYSYAKELGVPVDLLKKTAQLGRLPVVNFAAGGLATPADVSLLMQLGVDGVFVGSGIFKSADPEKRARAMVQAVTHYDNPKKLAEVSEDLGQPMVSCVCVCVCVCVCACM